MLLFSTKIELSLYHLLNTQARCACEAAQAFYALLGDLERAERHLVRLEGAIEETRRIGRIMVRRAETHAPEARQAREEDSPLSGCEGLYGLSDRLAGIPNAIEMAATYVAFVSRKRRPELETLAGLLVAITHETGEMVGMLRQDAPCRCLPVVIAGIQALERHGDRLFRNALEDLATDVTLDSAQRDHARESCERTQQAIQECAQVAEWIQSLVVKLPAGRQ